MKLSNWEYKDAMLSFGLKNNEILDTSRGFADSLVSSSESNTTSYSKSSFGFGLSKIGNKIANYIGKAQENYLIHRIHRTNTGH